ncbi:DUF302 domain-containing protein [Fodinibius sp. AD559]|uniref:DUF302 domain-containing protein n=1 Tax=Fodinibius sp. AD559 TaxID=3424179 RepID=UPI0040470591
MQKAIITTVVFILGIITTPAVAQEGMEIVQSKYSVEETTDRLQKVLKDNGLTIFEKVNHQEGASSVSMEMPPTTVLIFGNPKLGTPLMQCAPTVAIDLPQKVLIWNDQNGQVNVGYNSPDYLKKRHSIKGCDQELQKISGALQKFAQTAAGIN